MSVIKAAFAERTKLSLKKLLYRYMEEYGYQYNQTLSQFITTLNSGEISSIDLIPKISRIPIFYPFCTANHYEYKENPS